MKILLIASLLLVVGFCAQAQQTKQTPKAAAAPYAIPEEAVHQANPVKALLSRSPAARSGTATTAPCATAKMATARAAWERT
jgi:hypothetical protein